LLKGLEGYDLLAFAERTEELCCIPNCKNSYHCSSFNVVHIGGFGGGNAYDINIWPSQNFHNTPSFLDF